MASEEQRRKDGLLSPYHDAYSAPNPESYMAFGRQNYRPKRPILPEYTTTVLDCATLFGNTSLNFQFGMDFKASCEFWKKNTPLTDEDREKTLLGKRIKIRGLDVMPLALEYTKNMNIIDEAIVQDFAADVSDATKAALMEADVWVMQQCMSHMPAERLQEWLGYFLADRSKPKRFIYDFNPYFDPNDRKPGTILASHDNWTHTEEFYAYRDKTDYEYSKSQENGRDMCVWHVVVDFAAKQ